MRRQTFGRKQKPQYTQNIRIRIRIQFISHFSVSSSYFFFFKKKKKELCNISVWLEKQNLKEEGNA